MSITPLIFLLLFAAGILLALMRGPVYGIITCIFIYFMNPAGNWWSGQVPNVRYALIAVLVLAISFLLRTNQYKETRVLAVPHLRILLLLMGAVLISTFWAVDPEASHRFVTQWLKICTFCFLAYKVVRRPQELDLVLATYCAGCFYIGFHAWEFGRRFGNRLEVIKLADGTDGNGVAIALLLSVPLLVFYLMWGKRIWLRVCTLGALAFVVNALVLINSRGAFLGLVGALGLFALRVVWEKKDFKLTMKVALAGIICFGGFLYLADEAFWLRMGSLKNPQITQGAAWDEPVTDLRTEYWRKSFDMLADHPLGAGARGYEALSPKYLPEEWLSKGRRAVHSTWFEVLTNFGYQGLLLFIGYLLFGIQELGKTRKVLRAKGNDFRLYQSYALEASLVAFIIPGTFVSVFFVEFGYWPMMFIAMFFNIFLLQKMPVTGRLPENASLEKAPISAGGIT